MAKVMAGGRRARSLDRLGLVNGAPPGDWLDARDPAYIREVVPAIRAWSDNYFRAEVEGLGNIPDDGPVLLVGNHSGGTLIADTFIFAQAFYDHFGPSASSTSSRTTSCSRCPGIRHAHAATGRCRPRRRTCARALARAPRCSSIPGGDHETYRATWHSAEIDFAHRTASSGSR